MDRQLEIAQFTYQKLEAKRSHFPWWESKEYAFVNPDDGLCEVRDDEFIFPHDAHLYIFDRAVSTTLYPDPDSPLSIAVHEMGLDDAIGDMASFHQEVQRVLKGQNSAFLTLWEIIGDTRYTEDGNEYDEEIYFKGVLNPLWLDMALYTDEYFLNERERTIKPIMLGWDAHEKLTIHDVDDEDSDLKAAGFAEGDFPF